MQDSAVTHITDSRSAAQGKIYFVRLNTSEKVQHLIFMLCFVVLVITGFMLKIPASIVEKLGPFGDTVFYYRRVPA